MKSDHSHLKDVLLEASHCQQLDRIAIEDFGIPSYELMTRAANAALNFLQKKWPNIHNVLLVCGGGNNGGDGLVLARLLRKLGLGVDVYLLAEPSKLKGDARRAYEDALEQGVEIKAMEEKAFNDSLSLAGMVVDAILGTGTSGELRDDLKKVVASINEQAKTVFALDAPTGLCSDTGKVLGDAVRSDATITFISNKPGLVTGDARNFVGELVCDRLDIPKEVFAVLYEKLEAENHINRKTISFETLSSEQKGNGFKKRLPGSHKGDCGHVLLVGGDKGYGGAIALAGQAALRSGAGLVSIACHPDNAAMVTSIQPELMCSGINSAGDLDDLSGKVSVIALGPGLGQSGWSQMIFSRVMEEKKLKVIDADGLNWLANNQVNREGWVLTPHPGEAARLLGVKNSEVNDDRYQAAADIQVKYGGVAVLKGAGTLIQSGNRCSVCTDGNPGMASGGMGDVLTGVIAGLLAQFEGEECLEDIVELAVCLHSKAADLAAAQDGERGLIASDLSPFLRNLVN